MWNTVHIYMLRQVIDSTLKIEEHRYSFSTTLLALFELNRQCLRHREVLSLNAIDVTNLAKIDSACEFLFEEFAVIHPKGLNVPYRKPARIEEKLEAFANELILGLNSESLKKAWLTHSQQLSRIRFRPVDCLFVTALPIEFLAIVRRLHAFAEGTDPLLTRGFSDNHPDMKHGWVKGCISNRDKTASVVVICASRYGPTDAAIATIDIIHWVKPKHIIVVGIAASLGNASQLDIGDIGFSQQIIDISLGKDATDLTITSEVPVSAPPNWDKVSSKTREKLKEWISYKDGKILFNGILSKEDAILLQNAFQNSIDKGWILKLPELSQKAAETTDLKSTAVPIPCPNGVFEKAKIVAKEKAWIKRIQLSRSKGKNKVPRVKPVQVLSGSRVVKQHGMRNYLKNIFPDALLLEMEGAGVARGCKDYLYPMVIKSACDWATPEKEKLWQPYCADVAAAFALELALHLASDESGG